MVFKCEGDYFPVRIKFSNGTQCFTVEGAQELARELDKVTGVPRQPDIGAVVEALDEALLAIGRDHINTACVKVKEALATLKAGGVQ